MKKDHTTGAIHWVFIYWVAIVILANPAEPTVVRIAFNRTKKCLYNFSLFEVLLN
jgi:hypothetical protein